MVAYGTGAPSSSTTLILADVHACSLTTTSVAPSVDSNRTGRSPASLGTSIHGLSQSLALRISSSRKAPLSSVTALDQGAHVRGLLRGSPRYALRTTRATGLPSGPTTRPITDVDGSIGVDGGGASSDSLRFVADSGWAARAPAATASGGAALPAATSCAAPSVAGSRRSRASSAAAAAIPARTTSPPATRVDRRMPRAYVFRATRGVGRRLR